MSVSFSKTNDDLIVNGSGNLRAGGGRNEYSRLSQVVESSTQTIVKNVADIQDKITKIGTHYDSMQLRVQLHAVQKETNQLAKETGKYLKELTDLPTPSGQTEQRERKTHVSHLTNAFVDTLNAYQTAQRDATAKEKSSVQRARAASVDRLDPFSPEKHGGGIQSVESPALQEMVAIEIDVDHESLQEREQAIHQLESDILDINEVFKSLAVMVHEQGYVVDDIEKHITKADDHVQQASAELLKAKEYQNAARTKKCICGMVVAIILVIITILLAVYLPNKN